ncbi:MAG: DUF4296 domain-containing protein [Muribaculaceae bacterium]|nr:DUF4296 domain-containing protein [Muribaculaceae bacterium]
MILKRITYFCCQVTVIIAVVMMVIMCACSDGKKEVIGKNRLINLLVDMTIAESVEQSSYARELPDSVRFHLTEGILKQYGVTRTELDSTMAWYGRNLDEYVKLYSEVDKRLNKRISKESGIREKERTEDNLWPLHEHYWFTPLAADGAVVFEMPGEGIGNGESIDWSMVFSSAPNIDLLLGVDYDNGTSSYIKRTYRGDRRILLTLVTDTAHQVQRIYGALRVEESGLPAWVDSIKLVKHPYDSALRVSWSQKRYYGPHRYMDTKSQDAEQQEYNKGGSGIEEVNDNVSGSVMEQSVVTSNSSVRTMHSIQTGRSGMAQ